MSGLEIRYRAALRWYPATWREQNADVVVGTLMDEADAAGRVRPRPTELLSLALNGMRARLGGTGIIGAGSRDRLAALSFGAGFALMAIMFFGYELTPLAGSFSIGESFGPFASGAAVVNLLWMAAFVSSVFGLGRCARWALVLAVVTSVASILLINATPLLYARPPASVLSFLIVLAVLSMVGRPNRRMLLIAGGVSCLAFLAILVTQYRGNSWALRLPLGDGWLVAANGWWGISLFILAALLVCFRQADWVGPVAASAVLWCLFSLGVGLINRPDLIVLLSALIAITLALAVLATASIITRGYRIQLVKVARE